MTAGCRPRALALPSSTLCRDMSSDSGCFVAMSREARSGAALGRHQTRDALYGVQMLRARLVRLHGDREFLLEVAHQLEGSDRVEDAGGDQRRRARELLGVLVRQELLEYEALHSLLDVRGLAHFR